MLVGPPRRPFGWRDREAFSAASDQTETDTFGRVVHLPRRQSSGSIARCQSFTSMQKGKDVML